VTREGPTWEPTAWPARCSLRRRGAGAGAGTPPYRPVRRSLDPAIVRPRSRRCERRGDGEEGEAASAVRGKATPVPGHVAVAVRSSSGDLF
jgi:hypothetical protein